jgi:hypothetical protein
MSTTTNDVASLNGIYKEVYSDKIQDLIPDGTKLLNMIKFAGAEKALGNLYHMPAVLGLEHGFTYGGSAGSAFTLRAGVSATHEDAQVKGSELVLRAYLSVGAVSRSKTKSAFVQASKHVVENMLKSFARRLEVQLMYGQADGGIGVIESVTGLVIKIEDHEWAAGIWSGAEKMPIEIRSSGGTLRGEAIISSVDLDSKEITIDAVPGGTVATDVIYYASAYGNEFAGIHKMLTNTGTLFNINAGTYSLWKGNLVEVGTNFTGGEAVLSFAKVEEAVAKGMEKGLFEEDMLVVCNPKSWNNLLTEQAAKRSYDQSYSSSKLEQGSKSIMFHSQAGKMEIVSSIFCKEGYAYVLCLKDFMRVGSSDITLDQPGFEGKFVKLLETVNAYEIRSYSDQALFCKSPGKSSLLTFIKS